ncbi:hypothetical protein WJX72_005747 [[Myrmecia] bisecta]|uniref:Non-specific serine/threonine protein kinase n=1 Tax=[Myrmecia] bisecta TaxID=41462 RepID=A0AAW1QQX1_9CHLO
MSARPQPNTAQRTRDDRELASSSAGCQTRCCTLSNIKLPGALVDYLVKPAAGLQEPPPPVPLAPELARERVAQRLEKRLPSPSSYAKDVAEFGWPAGKFQDLLELMQTHRPAEIAGQRFRQLPVALLDPILGQLEEDCAYATPSAADTDFALKLSYAMSDSFNKEEFRMTKFWAMYREEFQVPMKQETIRSAETDGSTTMETAGPGLGLGVNLEVKLDVGSGGGDPRLQNCAYATLWSAGQAQAALRAVCRCPTVLLELAGTNLGISGFVFAEQGCCDQLCHYVSLLVQPKSELMLGLARVCAALRKAIPKMKEFYRSLQTRLPHPPPNPQLLFPYPNTYDTGRQAFLYVERISSLAFRAKSAATDAQVFVKFCKCYSTGAHDTLHAAGYAPRLLCCEPLPGRWLMVVTEFLEDACMWDDAMQKPHEQLHRAVNVLHSAGFVHGDLRGCNVLVAGGQVYVVDLEWAGIMGEAKYPFFMNRADIRWPDGASDNQPITKTHDNWWLHKLMSDLDT